LDSQIRDNINAGDNDSGQTVLSTGPGQQTCDALQETIQTFASILVSEIGRKLKMRHKLCADNGRLGTITSIDSNGGWCCSCGRYLRGPERVEVGEYMEDAIVATRTLELGIHREGSNANNH